MTTCADAAALDDELFSFLSGTSSSRKDAAALDDDLFADLPGAGTEGGTRVGAGVVELDIDAYISSNTRKEADSLF